MEEYEGEGPKWCIEHASTGQAVCQQAACKREKSKIGKGELRIGTHTLFDRDGETRWYMASRHWACATKHQIKGLKDVTKNSPIMAAGYSRLIPEAQDQVRLAFENDGIVDKEFKGISAEGAKIARHYGGDILNAEGYKVDIAKRAAAGCRNSACPSNGVKIQKGELRLGICIPFDGDHSLWQYKHWTCISDFDLQALQQHHNEGSFEGVDDLPDDYKTAVVDTLGMNEVVEPPKPGPAPVSKPKKSKVKREDNDEEPPTLQSKKSRVKPEEADGDGIEGEVPEPKPKKIGVKKEDNDDGIAGKAPEVKPKNKGKGKKKVTDADKDGGDTFKSKSKAKLKSKGKKRLSDEVDNSSEEAEYVPRKTRSRAAPMEKPVDPAIGRIQELTEALRTEAAK